MSAPQARRGLVPLEAAVVLAVALVPLPLPRVVPLLVAASLSRWLRGRGWAEVARGPAAYAAIGTVAGIVGLGMAVLLGTPLVESFTHHAVQWSTFPQVRGSGDQLFAVMVVVGVSAVAAELVLRGWLVERVLELSDRGADEHALAVGPRPVLAILVGALAEALLAPGSVAARIGAGTFGLAMGWMYVAGGRSVVAPTCARLAFQLGAVFLQAMRWVG